MLKRVFTNRLLDLPHLIFLWYVLVLFWIIPSFWYCLCLYFEQFFLYFSTLSVLSSSCSCTCSVQFPLEAESHLRTTTSRSPSRKEATWGTSIKTGPRNLDPLGPTCKMRQARPKKKNVKSKNRKKEEFFFISTGFVKMVRFSQHLL